MRREWSARGPVRQRFGAAGAAGVSNVMAGGASAVRSASARAGAGLPTFQRQPVRRGVPAVVACPCFAARPELVSELGVVPAPRGLVPHQPFGFLPVANRRPGVVDVVAGNNNWLFAGRVGRRRRHGWNAPPFLLPLCDGGGVVRAWQGSRGGGGGPCARRRVLSRRPPGVSCKVRVSAVAPSLVFWLEDQQRL